MTLHYGVIPNQCRCGKSDWEITDIPDTAIAPPGAMLPDQPSNQKLLDEIVSVYHKLETVEDDGDQRGGMIDAAIHGVEKNGKAIEEAAKVNKEALMTYSNEAAERHCQAIAFATGNQKTVVHLLQEISDKIGSPLVEFKTAGPMISGACMTTLPSVSVDTEYKQKVNKFVDRVLHMLNDREIACHIPNGVWQDVFASLKSVRNHKPTS
jgi:hypothetical protein